MRNIEMNFETPIDYIVYQLKLEHYYLTDNELKLLGLVSLKGLSSQLKKEVVKLGVFKSLQTVENHLTKFRKIGLLVDNKVLINNKPSLEKNLNITIKINLGANKTNS